ncbi:TonB-dependent receptor [Alteromonas ponticola]|uniref:TonB-dependent receptor n=1 Tax=Alteromonas ponticola TaxID=2720613 RepID=A0ABX1R4X1_9ALTE|nr:TonB-dependent receptor [Alteromonas ponticola]NMH61490.1 TonB-dependent receptor [Alteromonas ponticola]
MKIKPGLFKRNALSVALAVASLSVVSLPTLAGIDDATLRGKIVEQTIPKAGVEVVARDVERGYTSKTKTRADGSYIFTGLKPGTYLVTVAGSSEQVTLLVGQSAKVNFDVEQSPGDNIERISVTGVRLESFSGGEVGTNITPEMIQRLPQGDRNFLAFADLAPGVQIERGGNGEINVRGGAQNINKINVFLDGVSQKDYVLKGGVTGQDSSRGNPFPQAAISEYRVITQNYKAEYEHVSSAAITAVTKSGTNEFHGEVFYDFTDEGLREAEPNEADGKTPSSTEQYGATFSGPIIKDSLHFLTSYEEKAYETPKDVVGGDQITNFTLPAEYQAMLGSFPGEFNEQLFFGKLDWSIDDRQMLEGSIKIRDEDSYNFGGASTLSHAGNSQVEEQRVNLKYTYDGDYFTNEVRLTTEDVEWSQAPAQFAPAQLLETASRQRLLNVGGNGGLQTKGQKGWSIQNDLTIFDLEWNGYHVIKTGVKYKVIDLEILQQHNTNPQYRYNVEFNGAGTFNLVQPYQVDWFVPAAGSEVGGEFVSEQKQYGFYIQDDWEVNERLTLNLGIRYDYEDNPTYTDYVTPADLVATLNGWDNVQNTDYDISKYISTGSERSNYSGAWAPRVGFTYLLDDNGDHSLFGGFGRSYDRNQFDYIKNEVFRGSFATAQFNFLGDPDNPCDVAQNNCVEWDPAYLTQAGLDSLATSIEVKDEAHLLPNDLDLPYADQASLGVRSNLGEWQTEISISRVESHDQFSWYLGNRRENGEFFEPGQIWGPPWGFGLPDRGRSLLIGRNDGETTTDSIFFKLNRPHTDNWGMNLSYTFSDGNENRLTNNLFNLDYPTDFGYGSYPVAEVPDHVLVITGSYDLPWEIMLSGKFTYKSSPYKQYVNTANGPGQQFFDRIKPDEAEYHSVDVSISKDFATDYVIKDSALWVRLDISNLFNHSNYRDFILGDNSDEFGDPNLNSSTYGRRMVKLSAGWRF